MYILYVGLSRGKYGHSDYRFETSFSNRQTRHSLEFLTWGMTESENWLIYIDIKLFTTIVIVWVLGLKILQLSKVNGFYGVETVLFNNTVLLIFTERCLNVFSFTEFSVGGGLRPDDSGSLSSPYGSPLRRRQGEDGTHRRHGEPPNWVGSVRGPWEVDLFLDLGVWYVTIGVCCGQRCWTQEF